MTTPLGQIDLPTPPPLLALPHDANEISSGCNYTFHDHGLTLEMGRGPVRSRATELGTWSRLRRWFSPDRSESI